MNICDGCYYCQNCSTNNDEIATTFCLLRREIILDNSFCEMYTKDVYKFSCLDCTHFDVTCNQCAKTGRDLERFAKFRFVNNCKDHEVDFERKVDFELKMDRKSKHKLPIGVKPLWCLIFERVSDLSEAINRYSCEIEDEENRKKVKEWAFEISYLCYFLKYCDEHKKEDIGDAK